jgi:hypothetical protein
MEDQRPNKIKDIVKLEIEDLVKLQKIQELLSNSTYHESKVIDFKINNPEKKKLWDHISAFSFEGEGCILMGVDDDNNITGMLKKEFQNELDIMFRLEGEKKIGVWSWKQDKNLQDILDIKDLIVDIEKDLHLFLIFIQSKSNIVWTDNRGKYWYRNHDESKKIDDVVKLSIKLFEKFGMQENQNKIQAYFDSIVQLVKINYIDYHLNQPNQGGSRYNITEVKKKWLGYLVNLDLTFFQDVDSKLHGRNNIEIFIGDLIYKIPISTPFNYSKHSDSATSITKSKIGEIINSQKNDQLLISLSDIRDFFNEYSKHLTVIHNMKIEFIENSFPTEIEILNDFFQTIKQYIEDPKKNLDNIFNEGWNSGYLEYLSRSTKGLIKIVSSKNNSNNNIDFKSIKYKDFTIRIKNKNLIIEQPSKDNTIIDEIISKLEN